jgi:hypothetical protein
LNSSTPEEAANTPAVDTLVGLDGDLTKALLEAIIQSIEQSREQKQNATPDE